MSELSPTPTISVPHSSIAPLEARFGEAILRHEVVAGDETVVFVDSARSFEVLKWLKDDSGQLYNFLSDLTAVDYGGDRPIQVVYQLFSIPYRLALRVKVELPVSELVIDSVVPLWSTANWLEREVFDLFGVHFRNHPDLRRILMPDDYAEGHPLRKDFPLRGRFSRAEQTRRALAYEPEDYYIPEELALGEGKDPQVVPWREIGGNPMPREGASGGTSGGVTPSPEGES